MIPSPLQRILWPGRPGPVYLKREDLLLPGGGNKVRRFRQFFKEHPAYRSVVCLSDPGSHSFHVLRSFLNDPDFHLQNVIFLERKREVAPYFLLRRKAYLNDRRIRIHSHGFFLSWLLLLYFGMTGKALSVGIGGSLRLESNPHGEAFLECREQLEKFGHDGPIIHLFASASGMMLRGFLDKQAHWPSAKLMTCFTGDPAAWPWFQFRFRKEIHSGKFRVFRPSDLPKTPISSEEARAVSVPGFFIDPAHTIHLAGALNSGWVPTFEPVVFWMTSPPPDVGRLF